MMELVSEAVAFAIRAHDGMRRKSEGGPYILHPLEAAVIVGTMTSDQEVIAAAALHDVVEDAGVSLAEIESLFGVRVRELVASETENKRPDLPSSDTWKIRKEESLRELAQTKDEAVLMLWLADKLSNMRSFYREWKKEGDAIWEHFNQKDPAQHAWYYQTVASLTSVLSHTCAWIEYKSLTDIVFGKGN